MMRELGSETLAFLARGQQERPMLAASPVHRVDTSGLTNCMVS